MTQYKTVKYSPSEPVIIKSETINKTIHITVSLCTVIWFLLAIQLVVADTGEAIPPDLLMRWHKIRAEAPDTGNVVELLDEGERIIQRLQELEDLRRNTEKPVSKGYYQRLTRLQERFKDLLFHIEMARLSTLSPEKITSMRTEYEEERIRLEEEVIALEDSILARGELFLNSYRQKIALNHYMSKQEMIVDFIYRMAEIYYRRAEDQFFITNDVSVFKPALEKYQRIIDEFPSSE